MRQMRLKGKRMAKKYFTTMLTVLLLLVSGDSFAYDDCPEYEVPIVIITPKIDPVIVDYNKSVKELINLSDPEILDNGSLIPAGLTKFELKLDGYREAMFSIWRDTGETCAQITRYEFNMIIASPTIHIASEIPLGSCAYEAIMEHENRHIEAVHTMLNEVLPATEGYIRDFLAYQGIVRAWTKEEADRKLQEGIDNYFKGLNESLMGVSKKLQLEIDTPEEYKRLAEVCNGEASKIINKAIKKPVSRYRIRQEMD